MTTYLLITAVVIFACVFLSKVSSRLGIPMLLAFILLGMLFGSDGILKIPFDNYAFAEQQSVLYPDGKYRCLYG